MVLRGGRPLFLIDIAVPRNIQPEVGHLPDVHLYDIDDLQVVVEENIALRQQEIPKVEAIVQQSTDQFLTWLRGRNVATTIATCERWPEQISEDEATRAPASPGPFGDREEHVVRAMASAVVNKLLHLPTVRLKEYATRAAVTCTWTRCAACSTCIRTVTAPTATGMAASFDEENYNGHEL